MGANNSVPANYSTPTYAILALDILLTTAVVAGRTVSQRWMKTTPTADDYFCYFAFIANLGLLVSGVLLTVSGTVNLDAVSDYSDGDKYPNKAAHTSFGILYILSMALTKMSILLFYRRAFTMYETWFRWCWWLVLDLLFLWTVVCIILQGLHTAGKMSRSSFSRLGKSTTGFINASSSIMLLILPIILLSHTKLQKKQKIALMFIFGIGGIASIVSVLRGAIFFIDHDLELNEAYANYIDIILAATESTAGLLCACLPLANPILIRFTKLLQRLHSLSTQHQNWSTVPASTTKTGRDKHLTITRVDDFEVQLFPISDIPITQTSSQDREVMTMEKPWQSIGPYESSTHCESRPPRKASVPVAAHWEVKNTWVHGRM